MMERDKKYIALWNVMKRECRRLVSRPLYLFCMVIAPLFCYIFFTTLMDSGLPTNMPVGVVDPVSYTHLDVYKRQLPLSMEMISRLPW